MTNVGEIRDRYLQAQLAGDQRAALAIIRGAVEGGLAVAQLQDQVIRLAQLEIGRLWQENKLSVAHEHMATAISQIALALLFERARSAPSRGVRVLVACVQGEQHDFPARLVADHLELAGFEVRFLGANVPTSSLVTFIEAERPDVLALSLTMSFNAGGLRDAVSAARERYPRLPIVAGGHALSWAPSLGRTLGIHVSGPSVDELVDCVAAAAREGKR